MAEKLENIKNKRANQKEALDKVIKLAEDVKYGSITLVIQDGIIIQIDKNEKIRIK